MTNGTPVIFGEALFDCFEDDQQIPGGAPFNVAWHLQALGDAPRFVSRVGDDAAGHQIKSAMREWGMSTAEVQTDSLHPTGQVRVHLEAGEPHYLICENSAYDFIEPPDLQATTQAPLLYHGTLALRNHESREALRLFLDTCKCPVFTDINLRTPWWDLASVQNWLERARWCKLNQQELADIGFSSGDYEQNLASLQERFQLEQVILTRGDEGAVVRMADGRTFDQSAVTPPRIVDSVGAGDAFTAMYIHGLLADWPIADTLGKAQQFASAVLGQRGAIPKDRSFYEKFL